MSFSITQVNSAADTFGIWLSRTNAVINALGTVVLTVNSSAQGDVTTGNGYVNGVFGAFVIAANTIRGGTVNTTSTLNVGSNVYVQGGTIFVGNSTVNASMNSTVVSASVMNVGTFSATTGSFPGGLIVGNTAEIPITAALASNVAAVIDSTALTVRSSEYTLTIRDNNNANTFQVSKILVLQDTGIAYATEYSVLTTNGAVGVFSVSTNTTATILTFTPAVSNNISIRGKRTGITL